MATQTEEKLLKRRGFVKKNGQDKPDLSKWIDEDCYVIDLCVKSIPICEELGCTAARTIVLLSGRHWGS